MPSTGSRDKDTESLKQQIEEVIEEMGIDRRKVIGGSSDRAAAQRKVKLHFFKN